MEKIKIMLDGIVKDVFGFFYIYDSKYYFVYTEKEIDENDYVILYMTQVGKETKQTETGVIDTGYMIGVEITDPAEQQKAQTSISYIVEDKKNNTSNPQIQYLPMSMLTNLKIISKKRFRLLKTIMEENFKLNFNTIQTVESVQPQISIIQNQLQPIEPITENVVQPVPIVPEVTTVVPEEQPIPVAQSPNIDNDVIVDYRTRYFEEEEKNKELQSQIDILTEKLNEIKKVIE